MSVERKKLGNNLHEVQKAFTKHYNNELGGVRYDAFCNGWREAWLQVLAGIEKPETEIDRLEAENKQLKDDIADAKLELACPETLGLTNEPIYKQIALIQSIKLQQAKQIEELESKIKLAYENFSVWIPMNKGHICMGNTQRQQYN